MAGGRSPGSRWPAGPFRASRSGWCRERPRSLVADAPAALSEPADDVLGVDLSEVVDQAVAADGAACDCTSPVEGGGVHVEGDPVAGYLLTIEVPD